MGSDEQVAAAIGRRLAELGVADVFGVVGSGNFHVTNALIAGGARFVAARHEAGATVMADAHSRVTGRPAVVSVHQGPGLTNAVTGIVEAAKSRTPLLVLTGATALPDVTSNFVLDQTALMRAAGAIVETITTPATAVGEAVRAYRRAREGHTVVLQLPLDVQDAPCPPDGDVPGPPEVLIEAEPAADAVTRLADLLAGARRPVLLGGRGARYARGPIEELADATGALLATSAVARGLFAGNPWSMDVSGGFATPTAAELLGDADLLVSFGASLNQWTTRGGSLPGPDTTVVQVDRDPEAVGVHRRVDLGVVGDTGRTARALVAELARRGGAPSAQRTPELKARIAGSRWRDVPYTDTGTAAGNGNGALVDPRTVTIAVDDLLPADRTLAVDGGNFVGYPSMFVDVVQDGFVMPLAFQSIGLGLAAGIGAAIARPDRVTLAAVGDGGFMMSLVELDTAVRARLPLVVLIYDDAAYGAEVQHFGPSGYPTGLVEFPDTDLAAIARGFGCDAAVVRTVPDVTEAVTGWLAGPRDRPLVLDAKITAFPSWVLAHSFEDH
ncbi:MULTISPECIES: thiamine pyrophosphate-binding protein [Pseudonocardia]|uniref:Sulfoacetaldehyde acetyltransferase n=2 Tax=Pseudonocardia TaxID=1847 RepID=A0A1Y2MW71_PSEAH|nr:MULTISPECIES: thiamine pyrophosphate-binding protein [Pseudonocardia]OSY39057.1 Sulfoacetaldehyde acetyltransferase [Pseudonocardia autotrophica]TDN71347.1 thiamine pyrophosphate-dependent acetolactate synthase large subunit-like protein [Pseudonocardia autotrophica]BBG02022.1 acetolactate synthase I/II/III large subunit [Pseudonocardia autotrophica]GEC23185.1 acetolactate synthase I/II/III large subunit [Pseudonocardia saturnea]